MSQCAEAASRAEALLTSNIGLEAPYVLKDTELQRQAMEIEELKSFKASAEGRIKELEGQVEALTEEAAQAEVTT